MKIIDVEHAGIISTNKNIIDQKTFYIYKFGEDYTKIKLIIVEGIKTYPPLDEYIAEIDPSYNDVFTIPKGIIHKYHYDWVDTKQDKKWVTGTILVCTERDDIYAIQCYKEYLLNEAEWLKDEAKSLESDARIAKKKAKNFEKFVSELEMNTQGELENPFNDNRFGG